MSYQIQKNDILNVIIKRLFDVILSIFLLILFSPLFIVMYFIYLFFFGGESIYVSKRVGLGLKEFNTFKFRSMIKNAENLGPEVSGLNDRRNLPIARFIRSTKIDELPQLYNILIGDMSFVGPRPNFKRLIDHYPDKKRNILSKLKPGLTDYSSLIFSDLDTFVNENNFEQRYYEEVEPLKLKLIEEYYLKNSFLIDLKIIFFTIFAILRIYKFKKENLKKNFNIDI